MKSEGKVDAKRPDEVSLINLLREKNAPLRVATPHLSPSGDEAVKKVRLFYSLAKSAGGIPPILRDLFRFLPENIRKSSINEQKRRAKRAEKKSTGDVKNSVHEFFYIPFFNNPVLDWYGIAQEGKKWYHMH